MVATPVTPVILKEQRNTAPRGELQERGPTKESAAAQAARRYLETSRTAMMIPTITSSRKMMAPRIT